jgi:CO dehydrogenase maturation factor
MKLGISGKGGVGKTTLAAALIQLLVKRGQTVIALDADPNMNLAAALGFPEEIQAEIVPIVQQNKLIEERTGAKVRQYGQIFKMNPEVADVVDKYATVYNSTPLLVLGGLEKGGGGCACPENTFIRALVTNLVLYKNENLIMDMEAGVEHLGRGTARGVNIMIIVVEPSNRSINVGMRVIQMAAEIGLTNIKLVGNKIQNPTDEEFIKNAFPDIEMLGSIPFSEEIQNNERNKCSVLEGLSIPILTQFEAILDRLLDSSTEPPKEEA